MLRSGAASTLALAWSVWLLLAGAAPTLGASEAPKPVATQGAPDAPPLFDLVKLVAEDANRPADVQALLRGAHKQTRSSVQTKLGGVVTYPVTIPPDAWLSLGFTLSAAPFMVETPDLAEPTRFRVTFTEEGGGEQVLLERRVDPRKEPNDRRWFDERIDLSALAGKTGKLTFRTDNEGDPAKADQSTIYWSTPRIVVANSTATEPSLLFITIDCLRADRLGSHGYERKLTPSLDRLASEGVRFARAYANAPMTLPSIPQIFTSRVFPTRDQATLIEPIARAGIANAAFINNAWIPLWLSQGGHADPPKAFDRMVTGELDAEAVTDLALTWLEQHPKERFALYLHYLDAHTPYRPPKRYIDMFADPAYRGPVGDTFNDTEGANSGRYDEADRARIIALYDASIRYVDDQVGRLLDALRKSGRFAQTLIIVSADHGEELWEHGRFFHGQSLYDELLHIPLLVRLPGGKKAGTVVERPVRGIDIAPSILDWLELPRPESFAGNSLTAAMESPGGDADILIATATQAQFPTRFAVRTGKQKLIENLDSGEREVYDLASDPGEKKNVVASAREETAPLASQLDQARAILREQGYQATLVGPRQGEADVHVRLESHPKSGTFLTLDRRAGEPRPRLSVSTDGLIVEVRARVAAAGTGFRFDRLPDARNLGSRDLVKITIEVDGKAIRRDAIALGPKGTPPDSDLIDVRAAWLETKTEPPCPAPDEGVRMCLWRLPGERVSAIPEIKDPKVREKLRALGYLQ